MAIFARALQNSHENTSASFATPCRTNRQSIAEELNRTPLIRAIPKNAVPSSRFPDPAGRENRVAASQQNFHSPCPPFWQSESGYSEISNRLSIVPSKTAIKQMAQKVTTWLCTKSANHGRTVPAVLCLNPRKMPTASLRLWTSSFL